MIEERLFQQDWFVDLSVDERYMFLYLLSIASKKTGVFEMNMRMINFGANTNKKFTKEDILTIYGNRENVAVVRERDGKSIVTKLDLRSSDVFSSPCFYLEQNDIVIVSPNKYKAATAEINQNRSFWISLASTTISLATLVITILRKY